MVDDEEFYELKTYDAGHEPPVYRAFFEPGFVHNDENAKKAINESLGSLGPKKNPYLCTAEEMIAQGFEGTPYRY